MMLFTRHPMVLFLVLSLGFVEHASGQTQSPPLYIEGKAFQVGMSRTEATTLLNECCLFQFDSTKESGFIQSKADKSIVGSIFFRDGRVSSLRRNVKQSQDKVAAEFVLAVYRSLLDGKTEMRGLVNISARPVDGANFTGRELVFTFGDGRIVTIEHSILDSGELVVQLHEER